MRLWIAVAAAATFAFAPAAYAAQVGLLVHGEPTFEAAPGETNDVTASYDGHYVFTDSANPVTAVAPCTQVDARTVSCPAYSGGAFRGAPVIDLGDGSDTVHVHGIPPCDYDCEANSDGDWTVHGGTGNDTIVGETDTQYAPGTDNLYGGAGNDTITGGTAYDFIVGGDGNDVLRGGPRRDTIDGGPGNDTFLGGPTTDGSDTLIAGASRTEGHDVLDYSDRRVALSVQLDTEAGDGSETSGLEHDVLRGGFDEVRGGAGSDTLVGNELANVLRGNNGSDLLEGEAGADALFGGAGRDAVTYADHAGDVHVALDNRPDSGNTEDGAVGARDTVRMDVESIVGGAGDDTLVGDDAQNVLTGGGGHDTIRGGGNNDTIVANDGASDTIDCGAGTDTLYADAGIDMWASSGPGACETVKLS